MNTTPQALYEELSTTKKCFARDEASVKNNKWQYLKNPEAGSTGHRVRAALTDPAVAAATKAASETG